jgi:hypothetical protein
MSALKCYLFSKAVQPNTSDTAKAHLWQTLIEFRSGHRTVFLLAIITPRDYCTWECFIYDTIATKVLSRDNRACRISEPIQISDFKDPDAVELQFPITAETCQSEIGVSDLRLDMHWINPSTFLKRLAGLKIQSFHCSLRLTTAYSLE